MKVVVALVLVLAILCATGFIGYSDDVFAVGDSSIGFLKGITDFVQSSLDLFNDIGDEISSVFNSTGYDAYVGFENGIKKAIILPRSLHWWGKEYAIAWCSYLENAVYCKIVWFFSYEIYSSDGTLLDKFTRHAGRGYNHFLNFETAYNWCIEWK